ncbi:pyridoxamine 5'-phosphate oxidase family protein [Yoonia sp. 2307UL14-13]|uniref:pyridoxamine 5'-phosphate oxidase family protein n=1 Tax=Yoonia sp. 2307UL14-13 TaxID=3126506 RepID=UPI0030AFA2B8
MLNPEFLVSDEAALRDLFPQTHAVAIAKSLTHIDQHVRDFIARSPFVCIGTQAADGTADVSPRGDPCGFVKVLDERTLLIPDRPGNNRLDTLSNIVSNPSVGLLFMIPGYDETMRVNGMAHVTRDPKLLAVQEREPRVAIVVTVAEVFIHCAKAFRRSKLWDPEALQDRSEMPSLIKIVLDQTSGAPEDAAEQKKLDDDLEESYRRSLY